MLFFFRKIRKSLFRKSDIASYLLYAIGEIFLVVIGILVAVQIDNWNEQSNQRQKELHYLRNIKKDLMLNNSELDRYIAMRSDLILTATDILEYFEGKPLVHPELFFEKTVQIYTWKKFFQTNNTYQELVNTGNFALISNEEIKNSLLDLEAQYRIMKAEEDHFRFDSEVMLYEPSYNTVDINKAYNNLLYRVTQGAMGKDVEITQEDYQAMLSDLRQKNGFFMAYYEFGVMNEQMEEMKKMSHEIIQLIEAELLN